MKLLRIFVVPRKTQELTASGGKFPSPDAESVPVEVPPCLDTSGYRLPWRITQTWYLAIKMMSGLLDGSEAHLIISLIIKGRWILEHGVRRVRWGQKRSCFQLSKIEFVTHTHSSSSHWRGPIQTLFPLHHTFYNWVRRTGGWERIQKTKVGQVRQE